MTNVIFGFYGNEISVSMEETMAKLLFHDITGVSIIDNENSINENFNVRHPTLEELIEFLKININNEIGYKLIQDTFYPNYEGLWRKILPSVHEKVQRALQSVEMTENGEYEKIKYGKYVKYVFVPNKKKNITLDNFGIV